MDDKCDRGIGIITYEHLLWGLIAFVALTMRVAHLDAAPLTAGEAREAVLAWRAATGQGMPLTDYNPFLLAVNSLSFALFGAGDAVARLVPALFGACLALAPVLFRREMGRVGALAAGLYLAISPTALVASRQLQGTVISGVGTMAFLGATLRFLRTGRRRWLAGAAIGLALAATSGATMYGVLVPLGLAYVILTQLGRIDGLGLDQASRLIRRQGRWFIIAFASAGLLLATGLGWNLAGLEASGGLLAAWLGRFERASAPPGSVLALLMAYELWAVVFGFGGLIWGAAQRDRGTLLLGLWTVLTVLLLMAMPSRRPTDLLWIVLPLAMLGGVFVEKLLAGAWRSPSAGRLQGVHIGFVLVLWTHTYLMLARYAEFGDRTDLVLAIVAMAVQGLVVLSFGVILGGSTVFRTAAAGTAVALLAFTLHTGWGVAYRHTGDPRETMLREPTARAVRDLVETLEELSWRETGLATRLAFTYQAPEDSILSWYLREFDAARRVTRLSGPPAEAIGSVLVTSGRDETDLAVVGESYAGQDFPVSRQWTPRNLGCSFGELTCRAAYQWFLFREGSPLPEADGWATVWRAGDVSRSD